VTADDTIVNKKGKELGKVEPIDEDDESLSQEEKQERNRSMTRLSGLIRSSVDKVQPFTEMIQSKVEQEELPVEELNSVTTRAERIIGEVRGGIKAIDPDESLINDAKNQVNGGGEAGQEQQELVNTIQSLDEQEEIVQNAREKLENYKPPEYEPTEEEKEEKRQLEERRDKASQMSNIIDTCIDKSKPLLNQIKQHMDNADRDQKNDNLDEEQLVNNVKPLLQEATNIMNDTWGGIRALDPDGKIQKQAKGKGSGEVTQEEYYLADRLTYLSDHVQSFIDDTRSKLDNMPEAKKDLNPLLDMLQQPLFQIISAVGLLLSGVLGLVKNLLGGLGLDSILSGIGLEKVLDGIL